MPRQSIPSTPPRGAYSTLERRRMSKLTGHCIGRQPFFINGASRDRRRRSLDVSYSGTASEILEHYQGLEEGDIRAARIAYAAEMTRERYVEIVVSRHARQASMRTSE